jgi:hypothetical protein
MKSILDPSFRYTCAAATDLRKTFAKVRRELRQQQQQREAAVVRQQQQQVAGTVTPFIQRGKEKA